MLASQNPGKLREMRELAADLPFSVLGLRELDIHDSPEETGETFLENARLKARYFEPCLLRGRVCYVVPHPSGRNRWYNVEIHRARVKQFFLALLLALEGVQLRDGYLDASEMCLRAKQEAREKGRVYA